MKQGHWVYYGVDRPEKGYSDSAKIEEGSYINDRKEGLWRKFDRDGRLLMEGVYKNNRPSTNCTIRSPEMVWYSNCDTSAYDSISVHLGHANSYGPITDTAVVFYLDSLCTLDISYQMSKTVFCSHDTEVIIKKYSEGSYCSTRFSTCDGNYSKSAKVARQCAYKIFGFR